MPKLLSSMSKNRERLICIRQLVTVGLLLSMLMLCSACVSLPDDAREVFKPTDWSKDNNYKKD
jgi:hypothetical protein